MVGEAVGRRLKEVLDVRKMAGEICRKRALIDADRAVVVEAYPEAFQIADAVVTSVREGDRGEKRGLSFAQRTVCFERAAARPVRRDSELRITVLYRRVVG